MRSDDVSASYKHPIDCAINHFFGNELFTSEMETTPDEIKPTKYIVRKSEWKKKLERIERNGGRRALDLFFSLPF